MPVRPRSQLSTNIWHACRQVRLCSSLQELGRLPRTPKVVLASLPTLEAGPSRALLAQWAADPANLILFTARAQVLMCLAACP